MMVPENLNITIGEETVQRQDTVKFLGMHIDSKLEWHDHIKYVRNKISSSLYAMRKVKHILTTNHLLTLSHETHTNGIFMMQKKAIRIIAGGKYN